MGRSEGTIISCWPGKSSKEKFLEEKQYQYMMDRMEATADVAEVVEPGESGGPIEPHHHRHYHVGIRSCSPDGRTCQSQREDQSQMETHIPCISRSQGCLPQVSIITQYGCNDTSWPLEWPCQWCHMQRADDLLD
ncbi:hypothetical protein Scep_029751 [Stephania cephalantha]|uniref:Uncharacterized protein n=1 Tax=Stephania cephalantha TaxID=152367 RepID=A0AAP0HHZ1_9MAGN